MHWVLLTVWNPSITPDCLGGVGPFYNHVEYDPHIISMLVIILVALPMNLTIVYHYAVDLPPHPKFLLLARYRLITNIHIVSGSIEIIAGVVMFFVTHPVYWVQVQAISSIVHAVSAIGLIRLLFGMKLFMNIIYGTGVIMKGALAVNVFLHPDCYRRALALTAFHTVYAWVRVMFVFLRKVRIMKESRYTTSVVLASVVVLPVVDRLANAINVSLICVGGLYIAFFANVETRATYLTEFSRDITTFRHYAEQFKRGRKTAHFSQLADGRKSVGETRETRQSKSTYEGLVPEESNDETEDYDNSPEFRARSIYDTIAKGRQDIQIGELAAVLCSFGMPSSDVEVVMRTYAKSGTISYTIFFNDMKPLWDYMYSELKRDEDDVGLDEDLDDRAKCPFARMSRAYRDHMSLREEEEIVTNYSSGMFYPRSRGQTSSSQASSLGDGLEDYGGSSTRTLPRIDEEQPGKSPRELKVAAMVKEQSGNNEKELKADSRMKDQKNDVKRPVIDIDSIQADRAAGRVGDQRTMFLHTREKFPAFAQRIPSPRRLKEALQR